MKAGKSTGEKYPAIGRSCEKSGSCFSFVYRLMRYGPADRKIGGMAVKLEEKGHLRQAQEKSKEEKIRRHISDIQAGSLDGF